MGSSNFYGASFGMLFLFFITLELGAQKHDYHWVLRSRWLDTVNVLSFSSDQLQLVPQTTSDNRVFRSTNLTMSSQSGQLLFSSNGCEIWDSNFDVVPNSSPLNPGEAFDNLCSGQVRGYGAGYQSMLALTSPTDAYEFLIFHEQHAYTFDSAGRRYIDVGALLITKVDISSGAPEVVYKNRDVIRDTMTYGGGLTAVKHADLESWWLLVPLRDDSCYYRFLIDEDGIHGPDTQCIGRTFVPHGEAGGQEEFSHDGKKYIRWSTRDGLHIFDFDRQTGLLSNWIEIPFIADSIIVGGMAISPNNRFVYVATQLDLYQYDLEADDIEASRTHIASYDGHRSPGACTFGYGRLAPDCKIYWNTAGSCSELHVMHQPNEKGRDCDFRQHEFKIVSNSSLTMPYFPNYRLGTGEICDSSLMVNVRKVIFKNSELKVRPNPVMGNELYVDWDGVIEDGKISIFNSTGQKVLSQEYFASGNVGVNVSGLPRGVYMVVLTDGGKVIGEERVVLNIKG